jgi:membrane-associated protease RseP (regulator of RpoE activity)
VIAPLSRPAGPLAAVLVSVLAAGVLALTPPPAAAQETPAVDAPGWIGARVDERYNCGWETSDDWKNCTLVIQVREMQEDGPAARAGLLVGDRLAAMNGTRITLVNLPDLLASIRPSVPVSLQVTRDGTDRTLEVIPDARPPDADDIPMVGRRTIVATTGNPRRGTFVLWLTDSAARDSTERDRAGFALAFRDTDDAGVAVEPSAVRVVDGRLNVLPVRDRPASELPAVRVEILRDLQRETESAYRDFTAALQNVGAVRARLSAVEFRRRVARAARVALPEPGLAVRLHRTFAGAEFEPVRDFSDRAGLDGLLVLRVARGTVTARLGLRAGDLLLRAADRPTRELEDLITALESEADPDPTVVWVRGGQEMSGVWPRR